MTYVYYCYFHISRDWVVPDNSYNIVIWDDNIIFTSNISQVEIGSTKTKIELFCLTSIKTSMNDSWGEISYQNLSFNRTPNYSLFASIIHITK